MESREYLVLTNISPSLRLSLSLVLPSLPICFRPSVGVDGLLTPDIRQVERKKTGQPKARKKETWVKVRLYLFYLRPNLPVKSTDVWQLHLFYHTALERAFPGGKGREKINTISFRTPTTRLDLCSALQWTSDHQSEKMLAEPVSRAR
jgi:hypothetical protein